MIAYYYARARMIEHCPTTLARCPALHPHRRAGGRGRASMKQRQATLCNVLHQARAGAGVYETSAHILTLFSSQKTHQPYLKRAHVRARNTAGAHITHARNTARTHIARTEYRRRTQCTPTHHARPHIAHAYTCATLYAPGDLFAYPNTSTGHLSPKSRDI